LESESGESFWDVEILPRALTGIRNLPAKLRDVVWEIIAELAIDPYPPDAQKLRRYEDYLKIAFDGHRVVYRVSLKRRRVVVERVAARGIVYSGMER
jgi:mRNA-degrading endonuclease RelE of RelBE toxin-antitoxin system